MAKLSPMMTHYLKLKEEYPGSILLFRLGDFYEMFFDDAVEISRELDLTLTGRDCGLAERAPMCGVPYHAIDNYIARMIDKGYKVAICEQLTSPQESKGMVERDVVRIITPGTLVDDYVLDEKKNNYLLSIVIDGAESALCWCDVSTGELNATLLSGGVDRVEEYLHSLSPAEIICPKTSADVINAFSGVKSGRLVNAEAAPNDNYNIRAAETLLKKQLQTTDLAARGLNNKTLVSALGGLLGYLLSTQKRSLPHVSDINMIDGGAYMSLDCNTRRNLELTERAQDKKKRGSLLWVLDETVTCMGARRMRNWIERPLADNLAIAERLQAVEELHGDRALRDDVVAALAKIRDLERLSGKIAYGSVSPRDCSAICATLEVLPALRNALSRSQSAMIKQIHGEIFDYSELYSLLFNAIDENAPALQRDGGYIKAGYSDELDNYRNAKFNAQEWIANLEAEEKRITEIKNLKIGYNKVFGYFIEVSKTNVEKVPYRYVRKQTLSTGERYITDELKQIEDAVVNASDNALKLEAEIYAKIKVTLLESAHNLKITAAAIARADCLCSLAKVAIANNYVKPEICGVGNVIEIAGGRHPMVEKVLPLNEFISNDTVLDSADNRIMVITGPNMAGKSTYMRQVAMISIMAQIGSFVPADSAKLHVVDRIFTRIGASDDLTFGQSTFMVEMVEVAAILQNMTDNSLIILDEIGRGTSTFDGMSIAWAVMEYISLNTRAATLFSTHYHELTELEGLLGGVKNYKISVKELSGNIVFTHKISRGGASKSFGIDVAKIAGLPIGVISRAREIAHRLEKLSAERDTHGIMMGLDNAAKSEQLSLFDDGEYKKLKKMISDIDTDDITPLMALTALAEIKQAIKR